MTATTPTVILPRRKITVLAKSHKGELAAVTYANYAQAKNQLEKMGEGWFIYKGDGRAFFVALAQS